MKRIKQIRKVAIAVLLSVTISVTALSSSASAGSVAVPAVNGITDLLTLLGAILGIASNEISTENSHRPPVSFFESSGTATKPAPTLTIDDITYLCGNGTYQLTEEYTSQMQEILDSNVLSDNARKEKLKEILSNAEKQAPTYSVLGELFRLTAEGKNEITKKK